VALIDFLAETGARPADGLAMQVGDVDLAARTVLIERAMSLGEDEVQPGYYQRRRPVATVQQGNLLGGEC
jgi:hypothetical protein